MAPFRPQPHDHFRNQALCVLTGLQGLAVPFSVSVGASAGLPDTPG